MARAAKPAEPRVVSAFLSTLGNSPKSREDSRLCRLGSPRHVNKTNTSATGHRSSRAIASNDGWYED